MQRTPLSLQAEPQEREFRATFVSNLVGDDGVAFLVFRVRRQTKIVILPLVLGEDNPMTGKLPRFRAVPIQSKSVIADFLKR